MEAPCSVDIPMELSEFGVLAVTSLSHLFALSPSLVVFFIYHFCFVNKLRFCNNVLFYVNSRLRSFILFVVRDLTVFKLLLFCFNVISLIIYQNIKMRE